MTALVEWVWSISVSPTQNFHIIIIIAAEVCFREPDLDIMDEAHKRSLNTDVLHKKGDNPLPN